MNGIEHIAAAFAAARAEGRAALMPYYTLGYPDPETSLMVIEAIASAGADLIELGIPFSDPLADGPTIQRSTQIALEQGMTVSRCLEMVAELRAWGVTHPLVLMGYYNPILAFGPTRLVGEATAVGVDGFIVPDLPPEEAAVLEAACEAQGRALAYMLAPTSTEARIAQAAARTTGFLYLVSLTGVTGARETLAANLESFIARVRAVARTPLAVGFGISTPAQAQAVSRLANGVIVGSALINIAAQATDPPQAAADFVSSLRNALQSQHS